MIVLGPISFLIGNVSNPCTGWTILRSKHVQNAAGASNRPLLLIDSFTSYQLLQGFACLSLHCQIPSADCRISQLYIWTGDSLLFLMWISFILAGLQVRLDFS